MVLKLRHFLILLTFTWLSHGSELYLEPSETPVDSFPKDYVTESNGQGDPAEWKVVMDAMPSAMEQISPLARNNNRRKVIGQFSGALNAKRESLLIYQALDFEDFTLTTRIKVVSGQVAQNIGIVFRYQDPNNYYAFRIDVAGGWYYFQKVVNGQAQDPIGNRLELAPEEWHFLKIECKGPAISLTLNENHALPTLNDTQFRVGKVGYWTQADTIGHFGGTKITYRPRIAGAQQAINQIMDKYPRILQVSVYASETENAPPKMIACNHTDLIGAASDEAIVDTIANRKTYFKREKKKVIITLPVKDRNGEAMAACRVELKRFRGQTQRNAVVRAIPVVEMIQARILDRDDLFR